MSGRDNDQTRPISPSGASTLTIDQPWRGSLATSVRHTASASVSAVVMPGSQPGSALPMGFERGAGELLVMVVPLIAADLVDRPKGDLAHLVDLGPQHAAHRAAEVDDRDDTVRVAVDVRGPREHSDETVDLRGQPDLFGDLPQDRLFGHLVAVDPTRHEPPFVVVGAPDEQHPVVLVEDRGVDADLGRDVADVAREAIAYLREIEADAVGVLLRRDLEQLLVALAVERVGRVVKTRLRDGADLVEQREDVDALEATCPSTSSRRPHGHDHLATRGATREQVSHDSAAQDRRPDVLDSVDRVRQSPWMLRTFVVVVAVLVATWLAFVLWVWLIRPDNASLSDATRLLPDTLRLVRRLSTDRTVPRSTRWWIWGLLIYLASPIDLVPDFIPVIGYADDAIITSFVLRRVIARSGKAKLVEHWPGSPDGLSTLARLLRLPTE